MIPNFNTKEWDREKIIEYVIGNEPLNDQQLAFLDYFDKLQKEKQQLIDYLEDKIKEFNKKIVCYNTYHIHREDKEFMILKTQIYQEVLDFMRRW